MKIVRIIISFIIGIFLGIAGIEAYYQIVENELPYHRLSPKLGKVLIPDRRITYFKDGFYIGRSNEFGYLGKAYPAQRTEGKIRIALVGDSYTEGLHVFEQYHMSNILYEELNKNLPDEKYEVLNFGMGNANFNDMLIYFKNFANEFNPDIIIFNVKPEQFAFRDNFIPAPVLSIVDDSLIIDYSFTNSEEYKVYNKYAFLVENSCLVKSFLQAYKLTKKGEINKIIFDKFYKEDTEELSKKKKELRASAQDIDERIIRAIDWFSEDQQAFITIRESDLTDTKVSQLERDNVHVSAIQPYLDSIQVVTGQNFRYWKITNTVRGHWNHYAQRPVAEYYKRLVLNAVQENESE